MIRPDVAFVIGATSYLVGLFLILATDSWIMHLFLIVIPMLCIIAGIRYNNEEARQWRERLRLRKRKSQRRG
jgi:ABC-type multidrug transport system fused ATPase/permease subunit